MYVNATDEYRGMKLKAKWETMTDAKLKQNHVQEKYEQFLKEHELQLESRRKK
jgi:hypothetical protein